MHPGPVKAQPKPATNLSLISCTMLFCCLALSLSGGK